MRKGKMKEEMCTVFHYKPYLYSRLNNYEKNIVYPVGTWFFLLQ